MSENLSPPPPPPVAAAPAASLYPPDGGAAAAAAASTVPAGTGADTVAAGADTGTSTVTGGAGNDSISGGAGNDSVSGNDTTSSTITGGEGNDSISGGTGNDSLSAASYDFKLPEGFVGDDALMTTARETFAAAGVPADKAQGLVDLFGQAMKASSDAQVAAHAAQQTTWISEINAMPEFTGPTRETSLASIGRLFDEFGTPEAKAAMNSYGVGNNPALVKMMLKIANTVSEGAPAAGGRPLGTNDGKRAPKTVGQSLYGDPPAKQ